MRALEGPLKVVFTSWSSKVDNCANILQWNYAYYVVQRRLSNVDAAAGGTLMRKAEDEAYNIIEEMAFSNYQWSNERGQLKRAGGKFDVDVLTLLTAKLDTMTQKLDRLNVNKVNACALSPTYDSYSFFLSFDYELLS